MATLIFILILLTGIHFIYEAILAPSFRLRIRHKLLEMRDNLRLLKIEKGDLIPDDVFEHLEYQINTSFNRKDVLNLFLIYEGRKEFNSNPELREKVNEVLKPIQESDIEEIKEISEGVMKCITFAFLVNTGGVLIYLFPLLVLVVMHKQVGKFAKRIGRQIEKVIYAPDRDFSKIANHTGQMGIPKMA